MCELSSKGADLILVKKGLDGEFWKIFQISVSILATAAASCHCCSAVGGKLFKKKKEPKIY